MWRIIPVSSGKGGVGKTTFSINFALAMSKVAPTVLVDLDTGTSSVRNTIDVKVEKDLYHFFRKGVPLGECITRLPKEMDPDGQFRNFGFIAAPKHAIEEITDLSDERRWQLIRAINSLPERIAILDLRAGLNKNVLDFLPLSNSGILVFTPSHPAATLAAGDIVKSLMFRKLRLLFREGSSLERQDLLRHKLPRIRHLIDQVEDVYEDDYANLDEFLIDLYETVGDHPFVRRIMAVLDSFTVHFVLNMFDGVDESLNTAVEPFMSYLKDHVSSKLRLCNLGWIVKDQAIHAANCSRRPILLQPIEHRSAKPRLNRVQAELASLESELLGIRAAPEHIRPRAIQDSLSAIHPSLAVEKQLEVLNRMYSSTGTMRIRDNFAYIAYRALHFARHLPPDRFGARQLFPSPDIHQALRNPA